MDNSRAVVPQSKSDSMDSSKDTILFVGLSVHVHSSIEVLGEVVRALETGTLNLTVREPRSWKIPWWTSWTTSYTTCSRRSDVQPCTGELLQ